MAAWYLSLLIVVAGSILPALILWRLPDVAVPDNDKVAHLIAYLILALLPVTAVEALPAALTLAFTMIPLSVTLELIQRLVPGRSFEISDIRANVLGVVCGVAGGLVVRWIWRNVKPATRPEANASSSRAFGR